MEPINFAIERMAPRAITRFRGRCMFSVGAASCRDDRGWKPLPQGQHFIADRTAQHAVTRFFRAHLILGNLGTCCPYQFHPRKSVYTAVANKGLLASIFTVLFFPRIVWPQPTPLFPRDSCSTPASVSSAGRSLSTSVAWHRYCSDDWCRYLNRLFWFTTGG